MKIRGDFSLLGRPWSQGSFSRSGSGDEREGAFAPSQIRATYKSRSSVIERPRLGRKAQWLPECMGTCENAENKVTFSYEGKEGSTPNRREKTLPKRPPENQPMERKINWGMLSTDRTKVPVGDLLSGGDKLKGP